MQKLDKDQNKIVNSDANRICVIAGAGSGKTYTLVERIRRLLEDGADPSKFVCITYTNMAAQEMKSRLSDIPGADKAFIGTIHSFAYKILKKQGYIPKLLTTEIESKIVTDLIEKYAKHLTLEDFKKWDKQRALAEKGYATKDEVRSTLSLFQLEELYILLDLPDLEYLYRYASKADMDKLAKQIVDEAWISHVNEIYPETVRTVAKSLGYITFSELLDKCTSNNISVDYLFVDEFQDVGVFEFRFLKALNAKNVFIVGDDYQCQPENTKVTMSDASYKYICDIKPGDEIRSYDVSKDEIVSTRVSAVQKSYSNTVIEITSCNGYSSTYTPNHKCIVVRDNDVIETKAESLQVLTDSVINLVDGMAVVTPISTIEIIEQASAIPVYSLEVENTHCYFGDGILTHNSIYSFKGADFEYFKGIAESKDFNTYKLKNNYRSSNKIVNYSNEVISKIDDVIEKSCISKAPKFPSIVRTLVGTMNDIKRYIMSIDSRDFGKWAILTRNNDDMVKINRMCYALNIPSVTFKSGKSTVAEVKSMLAENSIKILTVHAAKGLEFDNVILYGDFPDVATVPKDYWADKSEECRIYYVGVTRAKHNLVVIRKKQEQTNY